MKWGMPTLVELPDMAANAMLCRRLGLDFVEINMNLPVFQHDALEHAAAAAQDCGIGITIHMDENFAPADFNPLIADAHMQTLRHTLRAAKRIGAPIVNMHFSKGVYFTLPEKKEYLFDRYRGHLMQRMNVLRDVCEQELGGTEVRLCIENTGGYLEFQKEAIDFLLESDVFGLTLDLGHWHKGKIDDGPFMRARSRGLKHFHVHDACSAGDHLALGDGEIDLDGMIAMADAAGVRCVVETKDIPSLERSVDWLREHGWM